MISMRRSCLVAREEQAGRRGTADMLVVGKILLVVNRFYFMLFSKFNCMTTSLYSSVYVFISKYKYTVGEEFP